MHISIKPYSSSLLFMIILFAFEILIRLTVEPFTSRILYIQNQVNLIK